MKKMQRFALTILAGALGSLSVLSAQTSFRFVSWGDTKDGTSTLAALSNQVHGLSPQPVLTIYTGDVQNSGFDSSSISTWTNALNGGSSPGNGTFAKTFAIRGNHDTSNTSGWQSYFHFENQAANVGATNYQFMSGSDQLTYAFTYGNSRFIGMDVPGDVSSNLSNAEITWLDGQLTAAESAGLTHAFIFFHGPEYCVDGHCSCSTTQVACDNPAPPSAFWDVINKHPVVTATFHGHEHVEAHVAMDSSRVSALTRPYHEFVTGTAGASLDSCLGSGPGTRTTYCGEFSGFAAVDVNGATVTVSLYKQGSSSPQNVATFTKTTAPPSDTTPPTVSLTAPAANATVSGSVTVTATATDVDSAVAGVQFFLDGTTSLGTDTTSPYSVVWNTAAASNGQHTLTARATDPAGNAATSSPVSVTVNNVVAVPHISVSPLSVDFGAVTVGATQTRTTTIQNTGSASLSVTALTTSGNSGFSIASSTPARPFTVAAGSSATVTLNFTPSATGNAAGQLTIASNDPSTPSVTVSLTGSGTTPPGACAITVTSALGFGSVQTGQSSTQNAVVGNTGAAACTVSSLAVSGTGFALGAGAPATPFQVAVGATVNVPVRFAPTSTGPSSGTLTVASNDPNRPSVTVPLSGTGTTATVCAITLSGTSLAFNSVTVGSSATLSVQAQNTGTANCSVTALTVTGTGFSLGSGAPSLPAQITPSNSISVPVTFHPTTTGAASGSLAVASTDPAHPTLTVSLSGTGQPAPASCTLTVDQPTIDFGSVAVGATANRTSTLHNTGGASCTVSSLGASGSGFALGAGVQTTPFQIAVGASAGVPLTFTPSAAGPVTGVFTIASSDTVHPSITVTLTGTGTVAAACSLSVAPLALDFGSTQVGVAVTRTTTIANAGQANCTLSTLTLGGSSAFTLHSPPTLPATLLPGESRQVQVDFTPASAAAATGTLTVGSTDPAQPSIVVSLTGTGVPPTTNACNLAVSPTSLDFGSVTLGSHTAALVQLQNSGTGNCTVNWSLAAGTSGDFTLTSGGPTLPLTLAAGATATASVTYAPSDAGSDAGSLSITSNDPDTPTVIVALAGTGVQSQGEIDLAILRFRVTKAATLGGPAGPRGKHEEEAKGRRASSVSISLVIENRSSISEPRQATVVGVQNGAQVYSQILTVSAEANGGRATFNFPSYTPTAAGEIDWTVTIADDSSTRSTATATTTVRGGSGNTVTTEGRTSSSQDEDDE